MLNWLNNFQLEKISFFIGFFSAIVLWFVVDKIKLLIPDLKKFILRQRNNLGKFKKSGIQGKVFIDAYNRAQSNHLTKELFSLDEILIKPYFLVDSKQFLDDNNTFQSETCEVVPFIPEFPAISRNFNIPRLTLFEAIQKNADIAVCGLPGTGKSVALADLVSELILKSKDKDQLTKIPLYIDVHDTELATNLSNIIDFVSYALSSNYQGISINKFRTFIKTQIELNNCIIIIDNLDELPVQKIDHYLNFINNVKKTYPDLQFVITISPYYYGNLFQIGFSPLYISSWSNSQIKDFYSKWNNVWNNHILKAENKPENFFFNSLLRNWTASVLQPMSPLEYTLFIWGAYAGDLTGSYIHNFLNSYINRILPDKESQLLLAALAKSCLKNNNITFPLDELKGENLETCIKSGLVLQTKDKKIRFRHVQLVGYLANIEPNVFEVDTMAGDVSWTAYLCYRSFLKNGSNESYINITNNNDISQLLENINICSYFLKYSTIDSNSHNHLLKNIVAIIQDRKQPFSIRLRGLAGIIESNDPNLLIFTRQLLSQSDENYKKLALFAIGSFKQDFSLINDVIALTKQDSINLEKLAYLVLSTFDNDVAIHELGKALLSANEKVRRIIAESFAFNKDKGEEILKDAITMDDIVVRRSAIHGLLRVNTEWAKESLRFLMIEDSQWVIRNAATQALEFLENENPFIPKKNSPLYENTWINTFAGKNNLGVSPEKSAARILLLALSSGDKQDLYNAAMLSTLDNNTEVILKLNELTHSIDDQRILDRIFLTMSIINNSKKSEKHPDINN